MGHQVTSVTTDSQGWHVAYFDDDDPERVRGYAVLIPYVCIPNRMGAHGITDPAEALDMALHEFHWHYVKPDDPRDDPALVQGWVTTEDPDSEPVHLYRAMSGRDATGAHAARMAHCRERVQLRDPEGLLSAPIPAPADVAYHREMTDITRWVEVYGDLPAQPLSPSRQPMGAH